MPPGIPYIIANELAERFSYYGMNSILVIFMTRHLLDANGAPDHMTPAQANVWYHSFVFWLYGVAALGAIVSDALLGKYRTILYLSIVYCFGHLALALDDTRTGLLAGLSLIVIGAGGIKPCVSANVGDQFGPANQHLLPRAFSWFYFSVNLGSIFATLLIPELLDRYGPRVAFGTPGIFMLLATLIFWLGRRRYVHVPPAGTGFLREAMSKEGLKALGNLALLVPFIAMFWAIWQQNFSSWVLQAEKMDRQFLGHEWLSAQIQTVNALFILLLIPLFSYAVYPAVNRFFTLTPLRKITIGMFLGVLAFLIPAWIESRIGQGLKPHIGWQVLAYIILTAAEVMVAVPHLEFSYTHAPQRLKSLVMSLYLGSMALGNKFTERVNAHIQNPDGTTKLSGPDYFLFFSGVLFVTAILFIFVAWAYRGKTYTTHPQSTQAA